MTVRVIVRNAVWYVFGSLDRDRLATILKQTRVDYGKRAGRQAPESSMAAWEKAALEHLDYADHCIAQCILEEGWMSVQAAQRELVSSEEDERALHRIASVLLREAETDKVGGWRAKAIRDLLCTDGKMKSGLTVGDLVAAMAVRDDKYNTTFRRVELRRGHLLNLLAILLMAIVTLIALDFSSEVASYLPEPHILMLAGLCGVLGACASVAQRMMTSGIDARIPEQVLGSFVVWMRPAVGAAAAIATGDHPQRRPDLVHAAGQRRGAAGVRVCCRLQRTVHPARGRQDIRRDFPLAQNKKKGAARPPFYAAPCAETTSTTRRTSTTPSRHCRARPSLPTWRRPCCRWDRASCRR